MAGRCSGTDNGGGGRTAVTALEVAQEVIGPGKPCRRRLGGHCNWTCKFVNVKGLVGHNSNQLAVMPCCQHLEHTEIDPYPLMTTQDLRLSGRPPELPDRSVHRKPQNSGLKSAISDRDVT